MTTAIIGVGNIGSRAARNLVQGGERVVLAARDQSGADSLAAELGPLATSASVADAVSAADAVLFAVWLDTGKERTPWDRRPTGRPDEQFCSMQPTTTPRQKPWNGSLAPPALIRSKPAESTPPAGSS